MPNESDLYAPIKSHLEALGYTVRGEVNHCDIVAVQNETIIAIELKQTFNLQVLYQALRRLPAVDLVYVAIPVPEGRKARANWDSQTPNAIKLCRMLGFGLMSLRNDIVTVHADPTPYQPRKQPRQRVRLLSEFTRRTGDHNTGGTNKRPRITAYREDALACLNILAATGPMKPAAIRDAAKVPKAGTILRDNVYGWFQKIDRGIYNATEEGHAALKRYADVVAARVNP